jgi:hypothetical protein
MIPIIAFRHPFFSWVLTSALMYSALFWAYYTGLIAYVLAADFTSIAASLLVVLIYCNLSIGWLAFKMQGMVEQQLSPTAEVVDSEYSSYFYTLFDTIGLFIYIAPTLGLLGTVIGLSRLMKDAATVDIDTIVELLGTGTGSALYPTAMGLILVVILTIQRFLVMHSFRIFGFARSL